MKKKTACLYPGCADAEREKARAAIRNGHNGESADNAPDFIGLAPNYEKFDELGIAPEKVLALLNID